MSYILEALKKIERKRAQEESIKPLSFYEPADGEARKRPLWPFLLIAALVLNAGILFWWVTPKGTDKKENLSKSPPVIAAVPNRSPAPLPGSPDQLKAIKKEMPPLRPPQSPNRPVEKKVQASVKEPDEKIPTPKPTPKPLKIETPAPVQKESTPPEKMVLKKSNKIFNVDDLPDGVKKNLPHFKISAHVYGSDPEGRLIRINDKTLQEGQEVAQGIRVEEIVPGGAILSYQGFRFKIGMKD